VSPHPYVQALYVVVQPWIYLERRCNTIITSKWL